MSNILVGFDFSKGSAIAVDLAIDIANGFHKDIRLVYVKEKNQDEAPIRKEIEERNAGVAHLLKGIKLEYVIREGDVSRELCAQAQEDNSSLVVVGTHGMSGFKKNLVGRNTYSTIADSPVPVLTIREDFNFQKKLEKIVVPLDSSADTRQKVPFAIRFAKLFGSQIYLLGLYTSDNKTIHGIVDGYVRQIQTYLDKAEVPYTTTCRDVEKNIPDTTLAFADEIKADMVVIMTEQETSLKAFLAGNYAQQTLTKSRIPVLTVRPEQINTTSK